MRILWAVVLLAASATAAAQNVSPLADSYVLDGAWAGSNFGTATGLFTKTSNNQNYDTYIKFDTSGVGGAGSVASAKLRVRASLSSGSIGMSAYSVSNTTWSETGITWNNKPARGGALSSVTVTGSAYTSYDLDVSSYVISEKAAGRNVVSFALHNPSSSSQSIWIQSRESGAGGPQLVITPNAAPTVSLTAPANNAVFLPPANVTVTANAADSDGSVAKVEFFDGATLVGTVTSAPYSTTLANLAVGTHSLTARATDNLGATATSSAVTIRVDASPSVSITSPANNAVFNAPASFTITATASDADGTVTKVDFYQAATLIGTATASPYSATVSNLAAGGYSFTAVATDSDGALTTSAAISVTVNAAPTVSITSPANSASFNAPATIPITASAQDSDGAVNRVELYANGTLIATLTSAPYNFNWSNVAVGTYALTAKAVDNNNAETLSTAVTITVQTGVAALYFIQVDHLNTPRLVADATGTTVWRWDQAEPFGNDTPNGDPGNTGNVFDFPSWISGYYRDKETGIFYAQRRDCYDSALGRFCQSDPIGLVAGLNTYLYVSANPLSYVDPDGLQAIPFPRLPIPGFPNRGLSSPSNSSSTGNSELDRALGIPASRSSSSSSSASCPPDREKQCDYQYYEVDIPVCRNIAKRRGAGAAERCYASAAQRYAACLRGEPVPPLDTYNN